MKILEIVTFLLNIFEFKDCTGTWFPGSLSLSHPASMKLCFKFCSMFLIFSENLVLATNLVDIIDQIGDYVCFHYVLFLVRAECVRIKR